jgi:hypothetical protein
MILAHFDATYFIPWQNCRLVINKIGGMILISPKFSGVSKKNKDSGLFELMIPEFARMMIFRDF